MPMGSSFATARYFDISRSGNGPRPSNGPISRSERRLRRRLGATSPSFHFAGIHRFAGGDSICHFRKPSVDLEIQAKQTKRVKEIGARILAANCGKKPEQIMKDFDRDFWMDAKSAIEYGIVDKVVEKL